MATFVLWIVKLFNEAAKPLYNIHGIKNNERFMKKLVIERPPARESIVDICYLYY